MFVVLGVGFLLVKQRRFDAVLLASAAGTTALVTTGLKEVFRRARPEYGDPVHGQHSFSFPSGHASGAFTVYVLLALLLSIGLSARARALLIGGALGLAALVAVTRVLLPVHYLSDVIAGAAIGLSVVAAALLARVVVGQDPSPGAASSTISVWQRTPVSRSNSSSRSSGPSLSGSVRTFDPDALGARQTELEQAMGAPGFWDDQAGAARISTEHARVARKLERYERLKSEYDDARELFALEPRPSRRGRGTARPAPRRAREAAGGRALQRPVRRGRCGVDDQRRYGRHRRAGLGRDDAAHVSAVGGGPWLRDGADRGEPRGRGRPQVGHGDGEGRERVRGFSRPSVASTGSSASRRSTQHIAGTRPSPRSSSRRSCPRTKTSRSTKAICASTRIGRAGPEAST